MACIIGPASIHIKCMRIYEGGSSVVGRDANF